MLFKFSVVLCMAQTMARDQAIDPIILLGSLEWPLVRSWV